MISVTGNGTQDEVICNSSSSLLLEISDNANSRLFFLWGFAISSYFSVSLLLKDSNGTLDYRIMAFHHLAPTP